MKESPFVTSTWFSGLEMENIRCFKDQVSIDFRNGDGLPSQWTIIVGENGVGKTSILRSLAAISPIPIIATERMEYKPSFGMRWQENWAALRHGEQEAKINAEWVDLPQTTSSQPYGHHRLTAWQKLSIGGNSSYDSVHYSSESISMQQGAFFPICLAYGASRHMRKSGRIDDFRDNASASLFDDGAEINNAEELYLQSEFGMLKQPTEFNKAKLESVRRILLSVIPDIDDIRSSENEEGTSHRAELRTPYGWVPVSELSLGHKTMVAWIVDFATRLFAIYPNAPFPLREPAICLVDEIDLHMHPAWQRKILKFLSETFPKTQFIVTAHSPMLVQAATEIDANLVLLKRVDDHVIVKNYRRDIRNWRIDQILDSPLFEVSARMPHTDALINERRALESKTTLSAHEQTRLMEIQTALSGLSYLGSAAEIEGALLLKEFGNQLQALKSTRDNDQTP